jgi:hypothetical protein
MAGLPTRDGPLLLVPVDARLPKVCLKCGSRHDVVRREHAYPVGTASSSAAGAGSGVVGVVIAQAVRDLDRVVAVAIMSVLVATGLAIAFLVSRGQQKVTIAVPLCTTCDENWTQGETIRTRFLFGLFGSLAILGLGFALDSAAILTSGGLLMVGVFVVALIARIPQRFVHFAKATPEAVTLRVEPAIADDVVSRAAKRAAREAAKNEPADADEET